jgi:hypothetical protein
MPKSIWRMQQSDYPLMREQMTPKSTVVVDEQMAAESLAVLLKVTCNACK